MKNFGVKNPSSLDFVREKLRKTKLEIEKSDKGKEISLKRKNSCRKHLGVDYPTQLERVKDIIIEKRRDKYFDTFVNKLYKKGLEPLFSKEEYLKARNGDVVEFKCLKCNETFKYKIGKYSLNVQHIYCPNPEHKISSKAEYDIRNWLKSLNLTIEHNKRDWGLLKIYEADIYLPEHKLVIEYDGIYWHSDKNKPRDYHYDKWKYFNVQNISCIQIFENEWWYKKQIIKDIILKYLNREQLIVYSHYCTIKNISEDLYKSFIENNYIKNYKPAEVRIGLYYNDELIECLGLSKSEEYEWEIVSNCSKIGYKIIDGFSSLINYFKNNYTGSIITFVDSRYFNTSEYIENGFKFIEHSKPKCYYFDSLIRKGLDKLFESVKEIENTFVVYNQNSDKKDLIYLRIYDAGYDVLVLE